MLQPFKSLQLTDLLFSLTFFTVCDQLDGGLEETDRVICSLHSTVQCNKTQRVLYSTTLIPK